MQTESMLAITHSKNAISQRKKILQYFFVNLRHLHNLIAQAFSSMAEAVIRNFSSGSTHSSIVRFNNDSSITEVSVIIESNYLLQLYDYQTSVQQLQRLKAIYLQQARGPFHLRPLIFIQQMLRSTKY
jgi:hypothetical protein